ncbi:MAG: hypothetical protein WBQ23_12965 [Bacteroidota bacterium]
MSAKSMFGFVVMIFLLAQTGYAGGTGEIQNYFSNTAGKVKATSDPVQKRAILDNSLQTVTNALGMVEKSGLATDKDQAGINRFKASLQEKQDELMGKNGLERVTDLQLNTFADYVVQDMQQADTYLNISLVGILLIIIILILIL